KHHVRIEIIEAPRAGRRVTKLDNVRVLLTDFEAPRLIRPEDLTATCIHCVQKFAADIPLALNHHSGKNGVTPCLGDVLPPWVPLSRKAERRIIHGEI